MDSMAHRRRVMAGALRAVASRCRRKRCASDQVTPTGVPACARFSFSLHNASTAAATGFATSFAFMASSRRHTSASATAASVIRAAAASAATSLLAPDVVIYVSGCTATYTTNASIAPTIAAAVASISNALAGGRSASSRRRCVPGMGAIPALLLDRAGGSTGPATAAAAAGGTGASAPSRRDSRTGSSSRLATASRSYGMLAREAIMTWSRRSSDSTMPAMPSVNPASMAGSQYRMLLDRKENTLAQSASCTARSLYRMPRHARPVSRTNVWMGARLAYLIAKSIAFLKSCARGCGGGGSGVVHGVEQGGTVVAQQQCTGAHAPCS